MTRLGHTPECRCNDCSIVATRLNIQRLEKELLDEGWVVLS